jgi:uncharacterized protein (TIGR00369 family)
LTSDLAPTPASETATASTFEFEPHNCFACGTLNEHGLRLDLHLGERRSWTELTLDGRFEGWVGIAHGGIVATILDEVMAWSLVAEDNWGVTARMTVEFRRPIQVGSRVRAEGWIVRSRKRIVETAARIVDRSGTVLATAEGTYLAADETRKRELQARYGYRAAVARRRDNPDRRGDDVATPESVDRTVAPDRGSTERGTGTERPTTGGGR